MCHWRYAVNRIQLLRAKSKTLKCTRQSQKIIWVTIINRDIKIKDKLIRVSSCSLEFKVSLAIKIGCSNPWCLLFKVTFPRFPWIPEVKSNHDLKATSNTFQVIAYTSDTLFSDNLSQKNCIYYFFFSEGTVTDPGILLVLNAVRVFLSLPTGTVPLERTADYICSFVAIFHKFISFCRLDSIFKQIVLEQIKPIDNLFILSFSLSDHFVCLQKKLVLRWILVANMSLDGLTHGVKAACN